MSIPARGENTATIPFRRRAELYEIGTSVDEDALGATDPAVDAIDPSVDAFSQETTDERPLANNRLRKRLGSVGSLEGRVFGNYVALHRIATGGMGVVYAGEHRLLGTKVAIKIIRQKFGRDRNLVRRFLGEAVAATRIGHRGVVEVLDYGMDESCTDYLVMEMLTGVNLATELKATGKLRISRAMFIARQTAEALQAVHDAGIVHRDLKPSNIFLHRPPKHPQRERVKLLDFGVAKFLQKLESVSVETQADRLLGTPFYMSPEQSFGSEIDHRSDIYALGCVLFKMVTGTNPFVGEMTDVLLAHRGKKPPLAHEVDAAVPPSVSRLIRQMMSKNPDVRPQTMADVGAKLTELIDLRQSDARRDVPALRSTETRPGFPVKAVGIWLALAAVTFGVGFLFGKGVQILFS